MYRGLFINNKKAKDSIYESGYMIYQCLLSSDKYTLDYIEIDINDRQISTGYNFYVFNYHPITMNWMETYSLRKKLGFIITVILEVAPGNPFIMCPSKDFDAYCVIDPTIKSRNKKVYPFPRPLEKIDFSLPQVNNDVPVIGTFGFSTKGKGFHHVVEAVNKEFDKAIVKINIPYGDFVPDSKEYALYLGEICKKKAKPGIEVQVTHEFMEKDDLIKWCACNTLNCFLYDRNMPGLAATTDQAIVSERPLSVSDNDTFRHIIAYLPSYPKWSLKDSIEKSDSIVKKIKEDWVAENFIKEFEKLLSDNQKMIDSKINIQKNIVLSLKKDSFFKIIKLRLKKYKRKFKKFIINTTSSNNAPLYKKESKEII